MHKQLNILLSLLAGILLTGCSYDDLPWDGVRNTEDEVAIAFTDGSDFVVDAMTRGSATEASTEVAQLDLIVFNDGAYKYHETFVKGSHFSESNKLVKVKRSLLADGNWYLIANAGTKVSDFAAESNANRSEENFKSTITASSDDIFPTASGAKTLLYDVKTDFEVPAVNSSSTIFNLKRLYAEITLKVAEECEDFLVTGTRFYAEDTEVALAGTPAKKMKTASTLLFRPSEEYKTTTEGVEHLSNEGEISFYVLPMAFGMGTSETDAAFKYPEPRLLLAGCFISDRDEDDNILAIDSEETFYAYKFPQAIEAGHQYILTLEEAAGRGAADEESAFENPGGAIVKFEDRTQYVNNIVTDGERVIAVQDIVTLDAGDADATGTITVHWRGKATDEIIYAEEDIPSWITNITSSTSDEGNASDEETKKSLVRKATTFSFTVKRNQGSEREFTWAFRFKGRDNLMAETVVMQKGANINVSDFLTINIAISGSYTQSTTAYFTFLNNVKGISPDANGSRVRNEGLHAPMPNGGVTYTYTITPKSGSWTITEKPAGLNVSQSGNTWTITFNDASYPLGSKGIVAYEVFKKALVFENSGQSIALDIYHTGFFHHTTSDWIYYEVFNAGGTYWLDRNIGAISAGMSHIADGSEISGAWPIADGSAGSYVTLKDAKANTGKIIPEGWNIPTQGDFEKLSMQRTFSSDRLSTGASTIFVPNYRQTATVYNDDRTQTSTVATYFPHIQYKLGSDLKGDDGSGYYLTKTGTDTEGYYRVMKFIGMNTTAETLKLGNNKDDLSLRSMSLRCVAGTGVDDNTATYSCQVKGYTHVFLYHVAKDGTKTFLNTWPGQEVATTSTESGKDMATLRYNPFSYTSYVNLLDNDGKLFVIFNKVVNGTVTESNVNSTAVEKRQGIPFMNGDAYDRTATPKLSYQPTGFTSNIVTNGNWKNNSSSTSSVRYEYQIKGSYENDTDWKTLGSLTYDADTDSWKSEGIAFSNSGQFVVQQRKYENGSYTTWSDWGKANSKTTYVTLDTSMKLYAKTDAGYNFRFNTAGTYYITLKADAGGKVSNSTITVSSSANVNNEVLIYAKRPTEWTNIYISYTPATRANTYEAMTQLTSYNGESDWYYIKFDRNDYEYIKFGCWNGATWTSQTTNLIDDFKTGSATKYEYVIVNESGAYKAYKKGEEPSASGTDYSNCYIKLRYNNGNDNWTQEEIKSGKDGKVTFTDIPIGNKPFNITVWDGSDDTYYYSSSVAQGVEVTLQSSDSENSGTISGAGAKDIFTVEWNQATKKVKVTKTGSGSGGGDTDVPTGKVRIVVYKDQVNWSGDIKIEYGWQNDTSGNNGRPNVSTNYGGETSDKIQWYYVDAEPGIYELKVHNGSDYSRNWIQFNPKVTEGTIYISLSSNSTTTKKSAPRRKVVTRRR